MNWKLDEEDKVLLCRIGCGVVAVLVVLAVTFFGYPRYKVFCAKQNGLAVKVVAIAEAEAQVVRAKGVAKANEIIANSLNNSENYLKYRWIEALKQGQGSTVVYVPTEAGLPILEASRLSQLDRNPFNVAQ